MFEEMSFSSYLDQYSFWLVPFYSMFLAVIAFANVFVLIIMLKGKKSRESAAFRYIVAISMVDLVCGAFLIPLAVILMEHSKTDRLTMCTWAMAIFVSVFITSLTLQAAVSLDRYFAIFYPIKYQHYNESGYEIKVVGLCIALGISFGLAVVLGFNTGEVQFSCFVGDIIKPIFVGVCGSWAVICIFVVVLSYGLIYKGLSDSREERDKSYADRSQKSINRRHQAEIRITKTMMFVAGTFMLLWAPITTKSLFIAYTGDSHIAYRIIGDFWGITLTILCYTSSYLNAGIDPIIYIYRVTRIRTAFMKILRFFTCTQQQRRSTQQINLRNFE